MKRAQLVGFAHISMENWSNRNLQTGWTVGDIVEEGRLVEDKFLFKFSSFEINSIFKGSFKSGVTEKVLPASIFLP